MKVPFEYDDTVPSHVSPEDGGPMSTLPGWSRRNWVLREASELLVPPPPDPDDGKTGG